MFHPYRLGNRLIGGIALLERIRHNNTKSKVSHQCYTFDQIITRDPAMLSLIEKAKRAAIYDKTLLITGDTGAGKEMFAQSVHFASARASQKFVAVNCGAIPKDLIASELFGYEPGAFTGALSKGKAGKFLLANGGTLFLDEIGELPLEAQAYLLRVIEERTITPLGRAEPISVDVRIIAATNRDLAKEIAQGRFREDLYYRLNVLNLRIPSLRERKRDIPLLVQHFLRRLTNGEPTWSVETGVMELFERYDWPGNIRQLKHVLDQIVFCADNFVITLNNLPPEIKHQGESKPDQENTCTEHLSSNNGPVPKKTKISLTREVIMETLQSTGQNLSEAARCLKVSRMTLYRKLKQEGLTNLSLSQ
jgi:transcriptional regulator with PAS, ATPase and Fis domain